MSGFLWEDEVPSFSSIDNVDQNSLLDLNDFSISIQNFTINESNISNKLSGVKEGRVSCQSASSNQVKNKNNFSSTSASIEDASKDFNSGFNKDPIKFYNDFVKPRLNVRHDLEYSFSQIFANNDPKSDNYIREFVEGRIANIIEKVRKSKSSSCSNIADLNSSQSLMKSDQYSDKNQFNISTVHPGNSRSCDHLNDNISKNGITFINDQNNATYKCENTDNINGTFSRSAHFSGSIEVLNCLGSEKKNFQPKHNATYDLVEPLKKSFSCSGLTENKKHNFGRNDSLYDIELKLDDSIPSEDERDEWGLPIKHFTLNTPQKKDPELNQIIQKYNILRASFCEPSEEDNEDAVPAPQTKNPDPVKEPLLPNFQGAETPPKYTENKFIPKGPMKALVPLQNMTKHVTEKIMSPFTKNKGKIISSSSAQKNTSHVMNESFDEKRIPMASSTPSSDNRNSRRESVGNNSRRSLSTGATPKRTHLDNHPNLSYIKPEEEPVNNTSTCVKPVNYNETFNKVVNSTNLMKPKIKTTLGLRRPSSAPNQSTFSLKAPLTTKIVKTQNLKTLHARSSLATNSMKRTVASSSTSNTTMDTTFTKITAANNARNSTIRKTSQNDTLVKKALAPLKTSLQMNSSQIPKTSANNLKRPSTLPKLRLPVFGKENK